MPETRRKKIPGIMRDILAINVKSLMDREFAESSSRPVALAKRAGLSLSTVQRLLSAETGATIDSIESVALALGVSPYQLLIPELSPDNPQVLAGVTAAEKRLYSNIRRISNK